jgi:carbon-monoxide dehydrogenase small subunit
MKKIAVGRPAAREEASAMFSLFRKEPKQEPSGRPAATKSTSDRISVELHVNGKPASAEIDPRTLLVQFLREHLRLTGTHVGCDTSQCGACVVHLDGRAVKSCTVLAASCDGSKVTTIEGLASDGKLHPMQEAFRQNHALQCGFCTPGMIMAAVDLVNRKGAQVNEATIREELEGNLCRCTGYHNIVAAVRAGAAGMGTMPQRQAAE